MMNIFRIAVTCVSLFAFLIVFAPPVSAQGLGGFAIYHYGSEITILPSGEVEVIETIRGEFFEPRHGLFRFVPTRYADKGGTTYYTPMQPDFVSLYDPVEEVHLPEPYEFYREGDFQVFKIGSPDFTLTGPFEYKVGYTVENVLLFHDTQDELFWNITGNDWGVEIPSVRADVKIDGVPGEALSGTCFTGQFGSVEQDCAISSRRGVLTAQGKGPMTLSVLFPTGLVEAPSTLDQLRWWIAVNWDWFLILIPLLTLAALGHAWWHHGRDAKGRGTIVAEYEPPNKLLPTEIGTLVDTHVHARDFSAGIIDLAVRGYLQIIEEPKKALGLKYGKEYRLKKLKEPGDELKEFEKKILDGLFGDKQEVELSKRRTYLVKARQEVSKLVHDSMAKDGYYAKNPATARSKYIGIGVVVLFLGHMLGSFAFIVTERPIAFISIFVTGGLFILFGVLMPKRTEKGAIAYEMAQGFKLYLETAEKHRIQWQEKEGIFEKYLPYAMMFGVADRWAKALATQATQTPGWYVGPIPSGGFNAGTFEDSISSFVNTASAVSRPQSSGGSSGGGGFSGGGFGGGGGGSW